MSTDDSVPAQLDEIRARLERGDARMTAIEKAVAENTEITKDIRDALVAGRVISRLARWLGGLAIAASAIYAALHLPGPPTPPPGH